MLAAFWSRPHKAHSNTATSDDTAQGQPKVLRELEMLKKLCSSKALIEQTGETTFVDKTKIILEKLEQDEPEEDIKLAAVKQGLAIANNLSAFWKMKASNEVLQVLEDYVGKMKKSDEQQLVLAMVCRKYAKDWIDQHDYQKAVTYFESAITYASKADDKEFKISCLIDTARCYKILNERDLNHECCKQASDAVVLLNSYMKIYNFHRQIVGNLDDSDSELAGNQIVGYLHAVISAYKNFNVPNAYRANVYAYFAKRLDGNDQPERGNFYARKALELVNYNAELKDSLEDELAWLAFPKERFIDMLVELKAKRQWDEKMLQEEENWFKGSNDPSHLI